jgi:hypothetical protein
MMSHSWEESITNIKRFVSNPAPFYCLENVAESFLDEGDYRLIISISNEDIIEYKPLGFLMKR